jgi:hypothetical protein
LGFSVSEDGGGVERIILCDKSDRLEELIDQGTAKVSKAKERGKEILFLSNRPFLVSTSN